MRLTRIVPFLLAGALVVPAAASAAPDAWLTAKTKMALLTAEDVPAGKIDVDTVDGRVTLHGTVASAAEKTRAEAAARSVEGVREVRNLLQVVPGGRTEAVKASDDQVKERVSQTLKNDASLADSSISVQSVNAGVVLLSGKAASVSDHLRALERAREVPGVRQVKSEVQSPDRLADDEIRREPSSAESGTRGAGDAARDMWITSATKLRLLANDQTPALDINVDTNNGVVTLFGMVPTQAAKAAAEAEAKKVGGVTTVRNELQVVPKSQQERVEARDADLETAVEDALKRRATLADADIDVQVRNGVARLSGSVPSEQERLEAAVAARSTKGVRAVEQDLKVTNAPRDAGDRPATGD
jgi:hyperosmotically inducible periplasmic protein